MNHNEPLRLSRSFILKFLSNNFVRTTFFYIFTAITACVIFNVFKLWPDDLFFFFTWPKIWLTYIIFWGSRSDFFLSSVFLIVLSVLLISLIIYSLRKDNKWYWNITILICFYIQIFIAILLYGLGV